MNKQKEKEVERIHDQMMYYGFDPEDAWRCATQLVTNGIRSAEGFQIEHDYDHNGVDYVDCSTIVPKEYEDDTTR